MFDDGEEAGVLGAQAFAQLDPRIGSVRAVINVDGMAGLSAISIDGPGRAAIIHAIAPAIERPNLSSAWNYLDEFQGGFDDSRVFLKYGVPVLGIRGLSGYSVYHTRLDALENVDAPTVDHKANLTLAAIRALAEAPQLRDDTPTVYFDVLSTWTLVTTRTTWWILAALATAALLLSARKQFSVRAAGSAAAALIFGTAAGTVAGAALHFAPVLITAIAAVAVLPLARFQRSVDPLKAAATIWAPIPLFAFVAPDAAYVFVTPALAAAVAIRTRSRALTAILPGAVAALALAPIAHVIYDLAGYDQSKKLAAIGAAILVATAPAFAGYSAKAERRLFLALAALFAISAIVARFQPEPLEHASIRLEHDVTTKKSRWIYAGKQKFAEGATLESHVYPWSSGTRPAQIKTATITTSPDLQPPPAQQNPAPSDPLPPAQQNPAPSDSQPPPQQNPAPSDSPPPAQQTPARSDQPPPAREALRNRVELPRPPAFRILAREPQLIRARVESARPIAQATLAIPPDVPLAALRIEQQPVTLAEANIRASNGYRMITVYGEATWEVELELAKQGPIEIILFDISYDAHASSLARLPRDMGDSTSVLVRLRL